MTPASAPRNAKDVLSLAEMRILTRRSDGRGFWGVFSVWAAIGAIFAGLAAFPHPLTFVVAVVLLGGRQLALAILMHEAAHRTLFERRFLNDTFADWTCARPIWNDVAKYKHHHLRHHTNTNTDRDPDLGLSAPFPTSRRSLARKFLRDAIGATALKRIVGQVLIALEVLEYTVSTEVRARPRGGRRIRDYVAAGVRNSHGFVLTNAALAVALASAGHLWVFSAWIVANLTTFNVFVRIRSLAEHACTEHSPDPFRNTRTTRAGLLARMTVAPIRVNYHLEHHLMVSVPYYRLPELRRLLRERGVAPEAPSYLDVLRIVSSRPAVPAEAAPAS